MPKTVYYFLHRPHFRLSQITMSASSPVPFFVVLVVLSVLPTGCPADTVEVSPDYLDVNCTIPDDHENKTLHLNKALEHYTHDTILVLNKPGCFELQDFVLVQNVTNYTIRGNGPVDDFVIRCKGGVGLAFVGLKEVTLQNLTVAGCGIRGKNTDEVRDTLVWTVELFFHIPNNVSYGMFLGDCSDVIVSDVTITKTPGIGLVAVNVIGNSTFNNLQLIENQSPLCFFTSTANLTSSEAIGGGMYILYQDYYNDSLSGGIPNLTINNAYIHNNSYCSSYTNIAALYDQSKTAYNLGYTIGGGGGMGVSLAQLGYKVNIDVSDSVFHNNTGWSNAGVYVGIFEGVGGSYLNFSSCQFVNNGYEDYTLQPLGISSVAGAFLFFNDVDFPNMTTKHLCNSEYSDLSAWLTISDSTFSGNTAYSCGAIESYAFQSPLVSERNQNQFQIINCTFMDNKAVNGPVFCLSSITYAAIYPALNATMANVTVTNNSIMQVFTDSVNLVEQSAHVMLSSSRLTISGNSNFQDNSGSVVMLTNSILYLQGNVTFENNEAVVGGAVQVLSNSYLVIENETNVTFAHNFAKTYGGAIFFLTSQSSLHTSVDCFLYFIYVDPLCNYSSCPSVENMTITVSFIDNNATVGGAVYGSTLNSCPWYYTLKDSAPLGWNSSALQLLANRSVFYFNPPADGSSVISTLPSSIEIKNSSLGILATPGQTVNLEVVAYDAFEFQVCATLSSISGESRLVQPQLGDSGFFFINNADMNGTIIPVTVVGVESSGSVEMALYSTQSYVQAFINVTLDSCGFGFQYNSQGRACECIPEIVEAGVNCNASSYQLEVKDGFWLGPGPSNSVVYTRCYYDHCVPGLKTFYPSEIDSQCNSGFNRAGYACGSCRDEESTLLGTSRCKECSNIGLVWIPVLAVVGIVAIFGISFLDVTITQGYINGFLFYCNCINYFIVYLSPEYPLDFVFAPLQWVNLALGIESCFYNGMTPLARIGLRFVFPLYLFLLMVILILLSRWFNLMNRLHFSSSKTFATLLLLFYISISGTCIEILGFTKFKGLCQNVTYYGWLQDPGVQYGQGWHGLLVSVAGLLMVVYVLPMPILLLFPKFFYSFQFTQRFIPMYDAFWNPFQPRFRFWLGFRALLRLVPFALALYVSHPTNIFAFAVFVATLFFIQERLSPFRSYWRNALDGFFLANLFLIILGNAFYERYRDQDLHYPLHYIIMLYVLIGMAYAAFIVILVIHVFLRFPKLHNNVTLAAQWLKRKILQKRVNLSPINTLSKTGSKDTVSIEETRPMFPNPKLVTYSEFREPLLDDEGTVPLVTRNETH